MKIFSAEWFMREALKEAQKAYEAGEVPVGAVVVLENRIIGKGHNQVELLRDATAHAEMLAITAATNELGGKFLDESTLFVTLEPCLMCAGALYWCRIGKVVYAARDLKRGFLKLEGAVLHPRTKLEQGPLEEEASTLLKSFFEARR